MSQRQPTITPATQEKQPDRREQLTRELKNEYADLLLGSDYRRELRMLAASCQFAIKCLKRERRRKTRSPEFDAILDMLSASGRRADVKELALFVQILSAVNTSVRGEQVSDAERKKLERTLTKSFSSRRKPEYYDIYQSYMNGKSITQAIEEHDPSYASLKGFERERRFRQVYIAICRLEKRFGARPRT